MTEAGRNDASVMRLAIEQIAVRHIVLLRRGFAFRKSEVMQYKRPAPVRR